MRYFLLMIIFACSLNQQAFATTTLKIATIAPDGTSWMKMMRAAGKRIEKQTSGAVRFRFFPSGVMGSDKSVLRKIRIGQLQGGAVSAGSLKSLSRLALLYAMPFTFRSLDEVRHVRADFDQQIKQSLNRRFEVLGMAEGGFAYLMSQHKASTIEQLKAQKIWVPEGDKIAATAFKEAGISPISLPVSDVYTSLQTGLINAIGVNPTTALALQWHNKINYMVDFPILFIFGYLIVDRKAFDKLTLEQQKIVRTEMQKTFAKMDKQNEIDEQKAKQAMQAQGVKLLPIAQAEKQQWQAFSLESLSQLAGKKEYPEAAYKQLMSKLRDYRQAK